MPQINLRVNQGTKSNWEEYVEESPEVNSISGLIRLAVTNEIEGREPETTVIEAEGPGNKRVEELEEQFNTLRNGLEDVTDQLSLLAENVDSQPSHSNLKGEIYSAIPKGENNAVTFEELVDRLGDPITKTDVSVWLDKLEEDSNQVYSIETQDGEKYYRE